MKSQRTKRLLPDAEGVIVSTGERISGYTLRDVGIATQSVVDYLNSLIQQGILPEPNKFINTL